jgi:H+-transporting ATPase
MAEPTLNEPVILDSQQVEKLSAEDICKQLACTQDGLTGSDVSARQKLYGPNALEEKKASPLIAFLRYFWGPIPWMIEAAAVLSLIAQDWRDFIIIMVMLLFNAAIGFWEEHKASNALDALKKGLALMARAKRDGQFQQVDAAGLVPGDVIRIRPGDVVPADCKLIDGDYISIDQAALTGESLPVNKKPGDVAYSGSIAKQGEMIALVTAIGAETFFGRTAKLVAGAGAVSHFQKAVMRVGDFLIVVSVGLSILLTAVVLYRDWANTGGVDLDSFLQLAKFVLILVIASIPVAMPAVLSVTMALGALALSKRKAIVSRLQAIEEMAGVDILCSDKTGTLTKNELTLGEPVLFAAGDAQECILTAALASKEENQDAIDLAVIKALDDHGRLDGYEQTEFVPFDPVSKRTEATVKESDGSISHCSKGAPQVIIDMCDLSADDKTRAEKTVSDYAAKGYRTLGVADSDDGKAWRFLGILPMSDPPRDDSKETIAQAHDHGLDVKMVTGDDVAIGAEISGQLGMGTHIQPANEIFTEGVDPDSIPPKVAERIEKADGFGRVFPEHKYGIVKALQSRNHIVAMTGDGVNDAPALKQADCGVAVSGATDAARAAAALILTAPGLSVIIKAIEAARQIFERMMSYTIYRIAMTIDVMFFVVLAMLIFPTAPNAAGKIAHFQPLTAVMIIILALLDDIPIMTIAYDHTRIDPKPVRWQMSRVLSISVVLGILAVVETFGLLLLGMAHLNQSLWGVLIDASHLQTMVFLQLVAGGHLMLFVTRTKRPFFARPLPSLPLFAAIVGTQIFAVLMCGFGWLVPALPWPLIGMVWVYNLVWMVVQDIAKLGVYRVIDGKSHRGRHMGLVNAVLHPMGKLHGKS